MPVIQQQKNGTYTLSLTRQLVKALGWKKGDLINLNVEENRLLLVKVNIKGGEDVKA